MAVYPDTRKTKTDLANEKVRSQIAGAQSSRTQFLRSNISKAPNRQNKTLTLKTKAIPLQYEVAAATDRGRVRPANEDSYGFSEAGGIYVVCDGMGGAAAGEVASRLSVDAVLERFAAPEGIQSRPEVLVEAIAAANDAVFHHAQDDAQLHGMGTTLVALLVADGRAWVAHVGDSRCYRLRGGALERLTQDHSLVDEQVRRGHLTAAEAERSPFRNVITRAIGSHSTVAPEVAELAVETGDQFLLCSDGLIREVLDERIGALMRDAATLESACQQLIGAANANGGHDNITAVLVRAR